MKHIWKAIFSVIVAWAGLAQEIVHAGVIELSGAFSFNNSHLGDNSYEWSRRWALGVGYYFWEHSEVEFSTQDVLNRTRIVGLEDTTFHDQIFSLDWVQYFASKSSVISPFIKLGVGQLYREASGIYWTGSAPAAIYASISVLAGVGLKVNFSHAFSVHAEGTTYLPGGSIATWQDNFAISFGVSVYAF